MSAILSFASGKQQPYVHRVHSTSIKLHRHSAHVDVSLSEARAHQAALWVEKEVDKLITELEHHGKKNGNEIEITFGELFQRYQDVSDTLVGILQRTKKRGIIKYEGVGGDLLLQGRHNHVVITLDHAKGAAWQKQYHATGHGPPAPAQTIAAVKKTVTAPSTFSARSGHAPVHVTTTSNHSKVAAGSKSEQTAGSKPRGATAAATAKSGDSTKQSASPAVLICIGFSLLVIALVVLTMFARLIFRR